MRILVIGLGSMGKRRIRNFAANGETDVVGFDLSEDRRREAEEKLGIKTIGDIAVADSSSYDAMVISTPPNLHAPYIRKALADGKHFFVETTTSREALDEAIKANGDGIVRAPSCTFRHFEPIRRMKAMIDEGRIGKPLAYTYHLGQYLPDWHPWEDYRNVFFSKKETGACRELFPFELCWINWVFGAPVASATGRVAKVSDLDMEADDFLSASLTHANGVQGSVVIEVVSRSALRALRVMGSDGVISWDWLGNTISVYNAKTKETEMIALEKGKVEEGYVIIEEMYVAEIRAFLDAIKGVAPYPYSFEEVVGNLGILDRLEHPSRA